MVLAWLKRLFVSRTVCSECARLERLTIVLRGRIEEHEDRVKDLKDEIQYLRSERRDLQTVFNRAMRLEVSGEPRKHVDPVKTTPDNWRNVKSELERKHKAPEGVDPQKHVHEYWTKKVEEMQNGGSQSNVG